MGRDESGALVMRINTANNSVFKPVIAGLVASQSAQNKAMAAMIKRIG